MRIEEIGLQHFGSFAGGRLALHNVRAATVSGPNGAGKSTLLLDAPLWCLWGKCRTNPDNMIKLGETEMAVTLTFWLNSQRYRVIRTRSIRTQAGKSDLQLQIQNGEGWKPMGGKSVRETQASINALLQATYELCTSTNFLVQGQFDQVSKATPSQRRALLCELLGISKYADYAVSSRQLGSRAEGELEQLATRVGECEQQVERYRHAKQELHIVDAQLVETRSAHEQMKRALTTAIAVHAKLAAQLEAKQATVQGQDQSYLTTQIHLLQLNIEARKKTINEYEILAVNEPALLQKKNDLEVALKNQTVRQGEREVVAQAYREADEALQVAQTGIAGLRSHESALTNKRASLETGQAHLLARITEYEQVIKQNEDRTGQAISLHILEDDAKANDQAIEEASKMEIFAHSMHEANQGKYQEITERYNGAIAERDKAISLTDQWVVAYVEETRRLEERIRSAERQVSILPTVPCTTDLQRQCGFTKEATRVNEEDLPPLRDQRKTRLVDSDQIRALAPFNATSHEFEAKRLLNTRDAFDVLSLEKAWKEANQELERLRTKAKGLAAQITECRVSLPDMAYLKKAQTELPQFQANLSTTREDIEGIAKNMTVLDAEIRALNEEACRERRTGAWEKVEIHDGGLRESERTIASLRQSIEDLPKVQHAKASLDGLRADLQAKEQELTKAKQELATLQESVVACQRLTQEVEKEARSLQGYELSLQSVEKRTSTLTAQHAALQATINQTVQAESNLQDIKKQRDTLRNDVQHLAWLTDAYKRVPILLLENALPVLEHEANRVLETISSSGMTLRIDTQKTLKSTEELVDTVDIIVRDQVGERPYEAFSGGERMRLDLALRLGLSKLISTRSGSKIQTLIMDEAFAPLDVDGVQRMRRCLAWLEEEYPLVLVITHDEELKDSLGSRIVVTPGPTGSTVEVLE